MPELRIEPMKMICPQCRKRTDGPFCPHDGYATVVAERFEGPNERLVGKVFDGRYRVEALVGLGGMGAVYRAVQLSMNRPVALKILRPEFATNLDQVRRFQTEARAASKLDHPNTIRVHDFGQSEDGHLYLVTELLEGESLAALMRRVGALAPGRAASIICQILKALSEAHAHGIVHRDLKPENIFLKRLHGEQDFVKVLDFGIAKVQGRRGKSLTTTGTVVGTPLYMSPEQAQGVEVGVASDIYAVGAVLYELLSGRPPFEGETAMAVMMAHIQSALAPLPLGDDPSLRGLSDLVARCLEKSPSRRPASADALREALEDFMYDFDGEDVPIAEPSEPSIDMAARPTVGESSPLAPTAAFVRSVQARDTGEAGLTREAALVAGIGARRRGMVVALAAALALVAGFAALNASQRGDTTLQPFAAGVQQPPDIAGTPSIGPERGARLGPAVVTASPAGASAAVRREAEPADGAERREVETRAPRAAQMTAEPTDPARDRLRTRATRDRARQRPLVRRTHGLRVKKR